MEARRMAALRAAPDEISAVENIVTTSDDLYKADLNLGTVVKRIKTL